MARVHKRYYNFSFGAYCGILIDEKTMKKIAKLQAKTLDDLRQIIANADPDAVHPTSWTIADVPLGVSQDFRTCYYITAEDLQPRLEIMNELFGIKLVKDLYDVRPGKYSDAFIQARKEHSEYLKSTLDAGIEKG